MQSFLNSKWALKDFTKHMGNQYLFSAKENPHLSHLIILQMAAEINYLDADDNCLPRLQAMRDCKSIGLSSFILDMAVQQDIGPDILCGTREKVIASLNLRDEIVCNTLRELGIPEGIITGEIVTNLDIEKRDAFLIQHPISKRHRTVK